LSVKGVILAGGSGFWADAGESIDIYHAVIDDVRRNGANRVTTRASQPALAAV
jgi:hypothetical protein